MAARQGEGTPGGVSAWEGNLPPQRNSSIGVIRVGLFPADADPGGDGEGEAEDEECGGEPLADEVAEIEDHRQVDRPEGEERQDDGGAVDGFRFPAQEKRSLQGPRRAGQAGTGASAQGTS